MLTGADSEFYHLEQRLATQGWGRRSHETAHDWLTRLEVEAKLDTTTLAEIVDLHYRYRFDPAGLDAVQRARLKAAAGGWLTGSAQSIGQPGQTA